MKKLMLVSIILLRAGLGGLRVYGAYHSERDAALARASEAETEAADAVAAALAHRRAAAATPEPAMSS